MTGIVLTKLDGTAKGGVVIAVAQALQIPVKFIGVGEQMDDLMPFDSKSFAEAPDMKVILASKNQHKLVELSRDPVPASGFEIALESEYGLDIDAG